MLEAALIRRPGPAGAEPLEVRIPLMNVPRTEIHGADGLGTAGLAKALAASLSETRARTAPENGDDLALAITLFGREPAVAPLARLDIRIAASGGGAWWEGPRPEAA